MPNVPAAPTIRDGVTASSKFNEFRDAINFLQNPPIANVRQTSIQSIANSTSVAVQLNAEDFDTDVDEVGGHDNVTNNTRFTARYAGRYSVYGGISFAANGTGYRSAEFAINGVFVNGSSALVGSASGANSTRVAARGLLVTLAAGDYIEIYAFQTSGGALNTAVGTVEQPSMSVVWVSR